MADYKTRLTADTSQHDQALKKSAQQVYSYKKNVENAKVTLGNLAKKFAPLAAQIGVAGGAFAVFNKAINSTEAGTDAMQRTMYTAKTSVDHFFKAISTGSFNSFLDGLNDIVTTAKEAYNALDDLGTMKMWKTMRQNQLRAMITEDQVIVRNPNTSASDRKAAQQRIELNMAKIQALTGDMIKATQDAADAVLKAIAGSQHSANQLKTFAEMRENGTLQDYMKQYKDRMSREETHTYNVGSSNTGYVQQVTGVNTVWNNDYAKQTYEAMERIFNATDDEFKNWVDLLNDVALQREQVANEQTRANKLIYKNSGGKSATQNGSIADLQQRIKNLEDKLKNENLTVTQRRGLTEEIEQLEYRKQVLEDSAKPLEKMTNIIEEMPKIDAKIIDSKGITAELQNIIDKIEVVGFTIEDLEHLENVGDSIGYIGEAFQDVAGIMSEEGGKMFSAIANSISAIGEMIAKVSALMMAEGATSVMSLPFPANMAALASVIATITSVIASIKGVESQSFADGGIFQGKTTIGDYNLARVNAGEMILNNRQQKHLFNLLNNPTISTSSTDGGNVTFTIHGSDLQGTLTNYNKRVNRVK